MIGGEGWFHQKLLYCVYNYYNYLKLIFKISRGIIFSTGIFSIDLRIHVIRILKSQKGYLNAWQSIFKLRQINFF